jgi:hypothetical protein
MNDYNHMFKNHLVQKNMCGKKRKIKKYLAEKNPELYSQFDYVLDDYKNKQLKKKLRAIGLSRIEIHVVWYPGYECVGIQVIDESYIDIKFYPKEINISCSIDEPDGYDEFLNEEDKGRGWIYKKIQSYILESKRKSDNQ